MVHAEETESNYFINPFIWVVCKILGFFLLLLMLLLLLFFKIEDSWLLCDNKLVSRSCKFTAGWRGIHTQIQRLPRDGADANQWNEGYTRFTCLKYMNIQLSFDWLLPAPFQAKRLTFASKARLEAVHALDCYFQYNCPRRDLDVGWGIYQHKT